MSDSPGLDLDISERARRSIERMNKEFTLSDSRWQTFNRSLGRRVRRTRIGEVKSQRNIDGSRYAPRTSSKLRTDKQRNKPMFKKILRKSKVHAEPDFFRIYFPNRLTGGIARAHQDGKVINLGDSKFSKEPDSLNTDYEDNATRAQAKRLRELGYKRSVTVGVKKSRTVKKFPGIRWITENVKKGQAGLIIRKMEGEAAKGPSSYRLPRRELLGLTQHDKLEIINQVAEEFIQRQKENK